jgi:hypothetical protein
MAVAISFAAISASSGGAAIRMNRLVLKIQEQQQFIVLGSFRWL